jgi:hypothetical protein
MLSQSPQHKVVVYIGRIAVENNVQALIDAVENLDDSWHAVIIGPQCVPLEHIGPRVHLLPAQRRIGNWLGIADVLCYPSYYESNCISINEEWSAGMPIVLCDYLEKRLFQERHGSMMWLLPMRRQQATPAWGIVDAYAGPLDFRMGHARDVPIRGFSTSVMRFNGWRE